MSRLEAHPSDADGAALEVERIVAALKLVIADFDGRATMEVTGKGGQRFAFFPTALTDNIPPLTYELSQAVCLLAQLHICRHGEATLGVGEEDRGAMIVADILGQYRLPRTLARWSPSGVPGEIAVGLANEYIEEGSTQVYLNGVRPGDRVLIVDDLISTGGTLCALVDAVRLAGADILEIFTVGEKTENAGRAWLHRHCGLTLKTLVASRMEQIDGAWYSRVTHVNLGHLESSLLAQVAQHFPAGFCRAGSGEEQAPTVSECTGVVA